MTRLAIHLNDAAITLLQQDQVVYREPGFAWLNGDNLTTGNEAFSRARIEPRRIQHRFWSELDAEPLKVSEFTHLSAADLVIAPRYVCFMLGVRFLTDHLRGDRYFKVSTPGENLERAERQFRLLQNMEAAEPDMLLRLRG